jgi:hypothetical protein
MTRTLIIAIAGVLLGLLALLLLLPTVIVALEGGFRAKSVLSIPSPDGRTRLVVTKSVSFPANEWVDPSIRVRAQLQDTASRRALISRSAELFEDSDFSTPTVHWNSNEVRITGFDRTKNQTLKLELP